MGETRPRLVRSSDPVGEAARLVVDALARVLAHAPAARWAIPGGSALPAVGAVRRALATSWRRVALTWVDERCVPFADAASNRGAAYRGGHMDEHDRPAHELPLHLDDETPAAACARVTSALARTFHHGVDVVLLGLGEDGHVASLFPGHPALLADGPVLTIDDSPKPPPARVTLALPLLARAATTVLLATGTAKRPALARVLAGDRALPASHIPHLVIVTDQDLAGVAQ